MGQLSRRSFLWGALGAVVAGRIGALGVGFEASGNGPAEERLVRLLRWPAASAAIGRAYLESHPQERSFAFATALVRDLARAGEAPEALRRAAAIRIRRDFAEGDVVRVRGWILSRTESRLAALALRSRGRV